MLAVRQLTKVYEMGEVKVHALRGVDLEVVPGEFISIMGPSGSGKTTLLNLIGGLDRLTGGAIFVEGRNLADMSDRALTTIRRKRLGFIFQSYNLVPVLTAAENVELPLKINRVSRTRRRTRVLEVMRAVGLEDRMENKPNQLSGGQQQRVAIARALVTDPAFLLADEPTGALDSETGARVIALLQQLNRDLGKTIVMVTHDRHVAEYATKICHMLDGAIDRVEALA